MKKNIRGFVDPISLIGITFLIITLTVGVSVTNNPVKKFLIDSLAGGRVRNCADYGSAAKRNACEENEDAQDPTTETYAKQQKYRNDHPDIYKKTTIIENGKTYEVTTKNGALNNKIEIKTKAPTTTTTTTSNDDELRNKSVCLQDGGAWSGGGCSYQQQKEAIAKTQELIRLKAEKIAQEQALAEKQRLEAEKIAADELASKARIAEEQRIAKIEADRVATEQQKGLQALEDARLEANRIAQENNTVTSTTTTQPTSTVTSKAGTIDQVEKNLTPDDTSILSKIANQSPVNVPTMSDLSNNNPTQYANCNSAFCNTALTVLDKVIPDSYINYWQKQVAGSKPTDNLLDIAFNRGTTLDTIDTVALGSFKPYVSNYQRINEETYNPNLNFLQNWDNAVGAGRDDAQTRASTIKFGTILTTEAYLVGVAPQLIAAAATTGGAGAAIVTGLGQAQVVSTVYQTGNTASYCTLNGWDQNCQQQTARTGITWATLGTSQYANVANNALGKVANTIVSTANLAVDSGDVVTAFQDPNADSLTKAMSVVAVLGDVGGGIMDFKQGQLGFSAPKVDLPADVNVPKANIPLVEIAKPVVEPVKIADVPAQADAPNVDVPVVNTITTRVDDNVSKPLANLFTKDPLPVKELLENGSKDLPDLHWNDPEGITKIKTNKISAVNSFNLQETGGQGMSVEEFRKIIRNGEFDNYKYENDPITGYELPDGTIYIMNGRHKAIAFIEEGITEIPIKLSTLPDGVKSVDIVADKSLLIPKSTKITVGIDTPIVEINGTTHPLEVGKEFPDIPGSKVAVDTKGNYQLINSDGAITTLIDNRGTVDKAIDWIKNLLPISKNDKIAYQNTLDKLFDSNPTKADISNALLAEGYNPGKIDNEIINNTANELTRINDNSPKTLAINIAIETINKTEIDINTKINNEEGLVGYQQGSVSNIYPPQKDIYTAIENVPDPLNVIKEMKRAGSPEKALDILIRKLEENGVTIIKNPLDENLDIYVPGKKEFSIPIDMPGRYLGAYYNTDQLIDFSTFTSSSVEFPDKPGKSYIFLHPQFDSLPIGNRIKTLLHETGHYIEEVQLPGIIKNVKTLDFPNGRDAIERPNTEYISSLYGANGALISAKFGGPQTAIDAGLVAQIELNAKVLGYPVDYTSPKSIVQITPNQNLLAEAWNNIVVRPANIVADSGAKAWGNLIETWDTKILNGPIGDFVFEKSIPNNLDDSISSRIKFETNVYPPQPSKTYEMLGKILGEPKSGARVSIDPNSDNVLSGFLVESENYINRYSGGDHDKVELITEYVTDSFPKYNLSDHQSGADVKEWVDSFYTRGDLLEENIPIGKFIETGCAVCKEQAILLHTSLAYNGIDSTINGGQLGGSKNWHAWVEYINPEDGKIWIADSVWKFDLPYDEAANAYGGISNKSNHVGVVARPVVDISSLPSQPTGLTKVWENWITEPTKKVKDGIIEVWNTKVARNSIETSVGTIARKGNIDISTLHPHEPGYNPKTTDDLTQILDQGQQLDPVKITEYEGQIYTYDGANRVTAYQRSGSSTVPYEFTEFSKLENIQQGMVKTASEGQFNIPSNYTKDFPISPLQSADSKIRPALSTPEIVGSIFEKTPSTFNKPYTLAMFPVLIGGITVNGLDAYLDNQGYTGINEYFNNLLAPDPTDTAISKLGKNVGRRATDLFNIYLPLIQTTGTNSPPPPAKITNSNNFATDDLQTKIDNGLYAQIDQDLATQTIPGGQGKPFKNIGCGQTAVANILCEYNSTCLTPLQVAAMIPLEDYGSTGLTSTQSNLTILNDYGFTTDPYIKSLQYHLTEYMEPTDVLWISGKVGGIDHHTYFDGYTVDSTGTPVFNLNDSYFGDGYKCTTSGDSTFNCVNEEGKNIGIGAENANLYIIDTNK